MTKFVIDIETCPAQDPAVLAAIKAEITAPAQYKKPESIAEWMRENADSVAEEKWRKTSFDGGMGHICVIGVAINDKPPVSIYRSDWLNGEADVLHEFFDLIDDSVAEHPNVRPVFIGHNLINFDLRFIFQRAVVLGVKPSPYIPFNAKPWGDISAFDTMTAWAGARDTVSLDKLGRVLCGAGKGDMDGSMVWDTVGSGLIMASTHPYGDLPLPEFYPSDDTPLSALDIAQLVMNERDVDLSEALAMLVAADFASLMKG